jgi:hypothetical protein
VIRLRRHLSRLLARWAVRLNPDPALSFTTTKVRDLREEYVDVDLELDLRADRWAWRRRPRLHARRGTETAY